MNKFYKYIILAAFGFAGCEPEFETSVEDADFYTNGEADFSTYVALGNSLTAGYADRALYLTGQENSYPNILAQQFALVGGGEFTQPLVNDNLGGLLFNGQQLPGFGNRLVLTTNASGETIAPLPLAGSPTTDVANLLGMPFNNMGVPGAKIYHLVAPGYGNIAGLQNETANPYFVRFASDANATVLADAAAQQPTFFSLWIGSNDILAYATSGGVGVDQRGNLDPSTYGSNDITDPQVFAGVYSQLVQAMTATATGGVLVNIPDVTSIPYFTRVAYDAIPLDAQTANVANMAYANYNGAVAAYGATPLLSQEEAQRRNITFRAGNNAVVILDESLTSLPNPASPTQSLPKLRQATQEDLLTLTSGTVLGTLANPNDPTSIIGVGAPLTDQYVLTVDEQALVKTAQMTYNATIQAIANANDLVYVDAESILNQVATPGVTFDGGVMTSVYGSGGAFSLDGVHPTARGYAYIANQIIEAINQEYGSTVPKVNIGNYPTITASNSVQ